MRHTVWSCQQTRSNRLLNVVIKFGRYRRLNLFDAEGTGSISKHVAVSPLQQGSTFCPHTSHCTWPWTSTGRAHWWHKGQRQFIWEFFFDIKVDPFADLLWFFIMLDYTCVSFNFLDDQPVVGRVESYAGNRWETDLYCQCTSVRIDLDASHFGCSSANRHSVAGLVVWNGWILSMLQSFLLKNGVIRN